ncbi:ABC transporter ATP-binding protein [Butyrivibrio sp. AC2005]|uniref:ABC transporter ATP-binding protein n=1 Tax=Butyrivibrio sp. AC2005 TaxID=1280672 RepID=UPI000479C3AF|nr:ABC transporter ATP-binding protein [Butyrivibrio sp. AC2005]
MQDEYSIEVDNIKKSFKVFYDRGFTLKEASLFKKRRSYETRTVIDGLSFKVKKGEAVALIGHNGCGKSTTLKMLTRILYPDSGTITMHGRVSSLLELGAGFHSDMTGRENIFINAAIFGLTHKEIKARMDDIIEFSELGEYIDNPVRTYSSGMYMRLAFAVAINVDADILLIDEILVVGDAAFQEKCFCKLEEIIERGTTIVLVSHEQQQIERICNRCIWICDGKVKAEGKPSEINPMYLEYLAKREKDLK